MPRGHVFGNEGNYINHKLVCDGYKMGPRAPTSDSYDAGFYAADKNCFENSRFGNRYVLSPSGYFPPLGSHDVAAGYKKDRTE